MLRQNFLLQGNMRVEHAPPSMNSYCQACVYINYFSTRLVKAHWQVSWHLTNFSNRGCAVYMQKIINLYWHRWVDGKQCSGLICSTHTYICMYCITYLDGLNPTGYTLWYPPHLQARYGCNTTTLNWYLIHIYPKMVAHMIQINLIILQLS